VTGIAATVTAAVSTVSTTPIPATAAVEATAGRMGSATAATVSAATPARTRERGSGRSQCKHRGNRNDPTFDD
jgi:hypothetical protein